MKRGMPQEGLSMMSEVSTEANADEPAQDANDERIRAYPGAQTSRAPLSAVAQLAQDMSRVGFPSELQGNVPTHEHFLSTVMTRWSS